MSELRDAIKAWKDLADSEARSRRLGICLSEDTSRINERLYRRTAQALELEDKTGIAHCSCCLLPMEQCKKRKERTEKHV